MAIHPATTWCLRLLTTSAAHVPLGDGAAAELASILLADDLPARPGRLARLLTGDAAVALWAQAELQSREMEWRQLTAAAAWLAPRLPVLLNAQLVPRDDRSSPCRRTLAYLAGAEAQFALARRIARRNGIACSPDDAWQLLLHLADFAVATPHLGKSPQPRETVAERICELADAASRASCTPGHDASFFERTMDRRLRAGRRSYSTLSRRLGAVVSLAAKLASLQTDFAQLLEAAKLDSLKEFAYGAGHEINNPLATIAGRAQTLLVQETDAERQKALAAIVSQAFRAHEMIADLMLFARPPHAAIESFDLSALIAEVARSLAEAGARQETVLVASEFAAVQIEADRTQVAVAVRALANNALQAVRSGGQVTIRTALQPDRPGGRAGVAIVVADDGPGISSEIRPHIFDPFFSGREAGRGLGFGLSKCWRIAQMHSGGISVECPAGGGAVFTLWLPLRRQD